MKLSLYNSSEKLILKQPIQSGVFTYKIPKDISYAIFIQDGNGKEIADPVKTKVKDVFSFSGIKLFIEIDGLEGNILVSKK